MLHSMRKGAGGWLAKGLLVLLVASFAVWGIGSDMLGSSVGADVIEVGDQTVTIGEFRREYQNRINTISQYVGRRITPEQAQQFGVVQSTILNLSRTLLEKERVNQLGLNVGDDIVLNEIKNGPAFKNSAGAFDRFRFQEVLRQNGYSEAEYVEILRADIKRRQLANTLASAENVAPSILIDTLHGYAAEKRSANYIELLDSTIENAPTPTEDVLAAFVKENPAAYTAPEFRKVSYITLTPEAFKEGIEVSAEEIQEEYNGRLSEFNVPEKRTILQMIFPNKELADAASFAIASGGDFADVAKKELQLTVEDIDLGEVSKTDLFEALQDAVFSLELNAVTAPVKTDLGWHLVKVSNIVEENTKTLEEVTDQLTNDIALRKAASVVFEKATALEDEFAGGASIAEAAESAGIKLNVTDWISQDGKNQAGQPVPNLPSAPAFLSTAFSKQVGDETDISEATNGTYFAVDVVEIKAAALRPLAEVKTEATEAWQARWRHTENQKRADALLEELKGGSSLEKLAGSLNKTVGTTPPTYRASPIQSLSQDAVKSLFDLSDNEYATAANAAGNGFVVFGLKEIVPADKSTSKESIAALTQQIQQSIQQDISSQYQSHLEKTIGVSVKEALIQDYI
ncbi:peptidylprolyl isomerase [Sneathiella aquimaris]|uniref:peptidylprolyl isomerase n=2 Tax=Sneathiella TaxID=510690 RepID=UPI00146A3499|nr:peptidylprolyl isomerase [Sneathiella aquimaris]